MFSATLHPKNEGGEKLLDGCIMWPHLPQKRERIGAHCTCDPAVPFSWAVWAWSKLWPEVGDILQPAGTFLLLHSWQLGSGLIWRSLKVVSCSWRDGRFLSLCFQSQLFEVITCSHLQEGIGFQQWISKSVVCNLEMFFFFPIRNNKGKGTKGQP